MTKKEFKTHRIYGNPIKELWWNIQENIDLIALWMLILITGLFFVIAIFSFWLNSSRYI